MSRAVPAGAAPLSWLAPAVTLGSLLPLALIVVRAALGALGADPIATVLNQLGLLALIFLLASLCCTPLKIVLGLKWQLRVRRTLGLFAFWTAFAHFLVYLVLDRVLALGAVLRDVRERPFIAVGAAAFVLLVPLAVTSTPGMVRVMGFKAWKRLHRLVYVIGVLGVVHFCLRVKVITVEQWVYGAVLAFALGARVFDAVRARLRR